MSFYSQNDEEKYIVDRFHDLKDGRFLDIGAYDGKTFSNTLRLVELGWSGVCVEPSPSVLPALESLHKDNPKVTIVKAAVGERDGKTKFFDSGGDAISTFDPAHKAKWEKGWKCTFTDVEVDVISVATLFQKYGYDFDFINLDVESFNWQIFSKLPFSKLSKLKMIVVEYDNHLNDILRVAWTYKFGKLAQNGENVILTR